MEQDFNSSNILEKFGILSPVKSNFMIGQNYSNGLIVHMVISLTLKAGRFMDFNIKIPKYLINISHLLIIDDDLFLGAKCNPFLLFLANIKIPQYFGMFRTFSQGRVIRLS